MSKHTVSEVLVEGNKILIYFRVNTANFGICRLANNGCDRFMQEYLCYFLNERRNGGINTRFPEEIT